MKTFDLVALLDEKEALLDPQGDIVRVSDHHLVRCGKIAEAPRYRRCAPICKIAETSGAWMTFEEHCYNIQGGHWL